MTSNSLSKISEKLSREIRKLEARLDVLLRNEGAFVRELRGCIAKLKELQGAIERLKVKPDPRKAEELMKLRLEVIKALNEVFKKESEAEHERSHLLESYGALILALEEQF